ncbi:hypothetical protein DFH08DRAFT_987682 [Mycena albidolilacea]|uniref:F-box domain-containing protein n=1 Tax=Mycena albidolilacea TaxID=1033008 RepID=A0AAD7AA93_9AGAR|nr:hypothetical protein DFH08DRAFT_987682 [Mycena albidolilacea]
MASNLPDEIVSEILSPALRVSDAAFSAFGPSPFMTFSESSSAFLLVCKSWLRVATPLLYNVAILRSKAQAQALAATLNANPALGPFIKKLRVEGGYAISMHKILQASKNITDIFLSMRIPPSDNACGLCRGLPLINPVRLILDWTTLGRLALKLFDTLEQCIPAWKKMTVLELRYGYSSDLFHKFVQAPNLETLVVWNEGSLHEVPSFMRTAAANPCLKRIRIEPPPSLKNHNFYDEAKANARLKALLSLADEIDALPCPFVYPVQLTADPVQEDAIWSRVLYFALYRDGSEPRRGYLSQHPGRLAPILVCKTFARLGVPHLYTSPVLSEGAPLKSFASQLTLHSSRVRCLSICPPSDMTLFSRIVAHTTVLIELHGLQPDLLTAVNYQVRPPCPITWKAFSDVGESTGASLRSFQGITVAKANGPVNPDVFSLFSQMREFHWDSATAFKTGPKLGPKLIPADTFSLLVNLTVTAFDASFLGVLSYMELPALRTVVLPATAVGGAAFFERHGAKLRELTVSEHQLKDRAVAIWRACPSLTVLGVSCDDKHSASASCFKTSESYATVERIVFRIPERYWFREMHKTAFYHILWSLVEPSTASFPALREIEHPRCRWPTTELEISKSQWVHWADMLIPYERYLVGPDGVRWRPRLQFVSKAKGKKGKR